MRNASAEMPFNLEYNVSAELSCLCFTLLKIAVLSYFFNQS